MTNRIRVAHIIHSLGAGGAESVLVELVRPAASVGIDMVVIGLSDAQDDRTARRLADAGVPVYQLHAGRYDLSARDRVRRILVRERIDLVHTHLKHADLVGGLAARSLGLPVVSTLHLIEDGAAGPWKQFLTRVAAAGRSRLTGTVVALSSAQYAWYRPMAGAARVEIIPNGVRPPRPLTSRTQIRAALDVGPEQTLAVTVSLMRPEKGHEVLLEAMRRIGANAAAPDLVLALAGDGPLLPQVRQSVEDDPVLRGRVKVLGFRKDVDDLLAAADLVVHPSLADALPTALISALASGRAVVSTTVGGIPDIVTPACGVLVAPADAPALARAITDLAGDPRRAAALGAAGRERYEAEFSAEVWAGRLVRLYRSLRPDVADPPIRTAAVLSAVSPYPVDNGKSAVIAGFLEHLVARLGAENVTYLHVGEPIADVSAFGGVEVREMGTPGRGEVVRSLIVNAGLRRRSLQETLTASRRVARRVADTLAELQPDLELIDTIRMEQHVRGLAPTARRVLYLDDLFEVRYRRMLEVLETDDTQFDPIGQFANFVPRGLHFLTRVPGSRRMLLRLEAERVARGEREAAQASGLSLLLNDEEAATLREGSRAQVEVVPPSLPLATSDSSDWTGEAAYCFLGLLSIPHNHDGLSWFLRSVFPRLRELRPDAQMHVIGRDPSPDLAKLVAEAGDSVVMHGFVADLDPLLNRMAAMVNPLRFGSGVKIKAIEALARGLPVVATPVGAEGISSQSRTGLVVVRSAEEMATALAGMAHGAVRDRHAAAAVRTFRERFSAEPVGNSYDRVFSTRPAALDDTAMEHRSMGAFGSAG